jgi:hypothetical protein
LYLTPSGCFHWTISKSLVDALKDGAHDKERKGYRFADFSFGEFATELPEIVEATEFYEAGSELLQEDCRRSGY